MKLIFVILSIFCVILSVQGSDDACSQPKDAGPCRGMMPKFYYNSAAKECQRFDYGGCQGNSNNFKTKEDCEAACKQ